MNKNPNVGWSDYTVESPVVDLAVVIGRFQPVHNGHLSLFKKATKISNNRLILVGSCFVARNIKNPFTFEERKKMIELATKPIGQFDIEPVMDDLYNDQVWVGNVQAQIDMALEDRGIDPKTAKVAIVGHYKDESSYYLHMFPKYNFVEVSAIGMGSGLSGTEIRQRLFNRCSSVLGLDEVMPFGVPQYLFDFKTKNPEIHDQLCEEYKFLQDYKKQFDSLPYPPTFVTVDSVVINHGHILLVKRRSHPGKGLWALPGGFLNQNEFIEQAILRELKEETKIAVNDVLLKASLKGVHVFDAPNRSLRGRTITHAGLFIMNTPELPKVKGSDDAEKAKWVPLSQFYEMTDQLFEDHYSIGTYMISRAG